MLDKKINDNVFLMYVIGMALSVSGIFAQHSNDDFAIGVQIGSGVGEIKPTAKKWEVLGIGIIIVSNI